MPCDRSLQSKNTFSVNFDCPGSEPSQNIRLWNFWKYSRSRPNFLRVVRFWLEAFTGFGVIKLKRLIILFLLIFNACNQFSRGVNTSPLQSRHDFMRVMYISCVGESSVSLTISRPPSTVHQTWRCKRNQVKFFISFRVIQHKRAFLITHSHSTQRKPLAPRRY